MSEPFNSQMPTAYDDATTLLGDLIDQRNFTLASGIDNAVTTIPILGTVDDIEFPVYLKFDTGEIVFSEAPKADLKGFDDCVRGVRGTTASAHTAGEAFYLNLTGQHLNLLKKAVVAGQKFIGLAGLDVDLPTTPSVNEVYVATDTEKVYVCLTAGVWTWVGNRDDHADLDGLGADDHAQYHTDGRAGAWHDGLPGGHVQGGDTHDHGYAGVLGAGRIQSGLDANLPDPPNYEREIWYATDTNFLYISTGTLSGDFKKITGAPAGTIVAFLEADITNLYSGSCPDGWTRFTALDGKFPRGAPAGVTGSFGSGGALTHAHTYTDLPEHSHVLPQTNASTNSNGSHNHKIPAGGGGSLEGLLYDGGNSINTGTVGGGGSHTHSITIPTRDVSAAKKTSDDSAGVATGTASTESNLPPYQEVVFCIKS